METETVRDKENEGKRLRRKIYKNELSLTAIMACSVVLQCK